MTDYPFHFDGCTIYGPLHRLIWRSDPPFTETVCRPHDEAYWEGGTMLAKLRADLNMLGGMWTAGYRVSGVLAFLALQLLLPAIVLAPLPRNWRWGGGWRWPRYKA